MARSNRTNAASSTCKNCDRCAFANDAGPANDVAASTQVGHDRPGGDCAADARRRERLARGPMLQRNTLSLSAIVASP